MDSVKERLDTDVETGIYLSGGLDSSAIVWIAQSLSPSIETFSVGFSKGDFNEANQAKNLADFLGVKNSQIICDENYAISFLDNLSSILDEPMADPSIIPTTLLSEFASQKIKVALGGDGSDEIGYGYNTFRQFEKVGMAKRYVPRALLDFSIRTFGEGTLSGKLKNVSEILDFNESELIANATSPFFRYRFNANLDKDFLPLKSGVGRYFSAKLSDDPVVDAYVSTYMREQILVKIDRASMFSSVELRSPFLDYNLAAYMSTCDKSFKFRQGQGKLPLRTFLEGKVPPEVLSRPKKGFGIPLQSWLDGAFGDRIMEIVLDGDWSNTKLDSPLFEDLAKSLRMSKDNPGAAEFLWSLAVFQLWRNDWA
jgi:asparagine synthase (glutamine-hydrolysing)